MDEKIILSVFFPHHSDSCGYVKTLCNAFCLVYLHAFFMKLVSTSVYFLAFTLVQTTESFSFCPSVPEWSKYTSRTPAAVSQYVCVSILGLTSFGVPKCCPQCIPALLFLNKYALDGTAVDFGQPGIPQCLSTWPATTAAMAESVYRVRMLKCLLQKLPSLERKCPHIEKQYVSYFISFKR